MYGIYYADFDFCRKLIRWKCKIDTVNNYGYTPLLIAYELDKIYIFKMLINEGADIIDFLKRWRNKKLLEYGMSGLDSKSMKCVLCSNILKIKANL